MKLGSRGAFLFFISVLILAGLSGIYFYRTAHAPAAPISDKFTTGTFGGVSLNIELATTTADQELGLGNRPSIPHNYGMLFVFPYDDYWAFWMKDTLIPLDMFWLNDQGQVVYIAQNVQPDSYPTAFRPTTPARYVLETNAGFAAANNIASGTELVLQKSDGVLK